MNQSEQSIKAISRDRLFLFLPGFYLPLIVLGILTLGFWLFKWDMGFQSMFYHPTEGWYLANILPFKLVYHYGNYPALLLALAGLLALILSYSKMKMLKWRKVGLFLTLVMVVGPGIIVNTILKDQWGRPRPRNVIEFGGENQYEYPLQIDTSSKGKSFPCGHATMGYYFFSVGLLISYRRRLIKLLAILFATVYGSLIGLARIAQGGHFLSDVIWAGVLIYVISFALYRLLKMHRSIWYEPLTGRKGGLNRIQKIGLYTLIPLIVIGVLLATPYAQKQSIELGTNAYFLEMSLVDTALELTPGDQDLLTAESNGFGAPGSKVRYRLKTNSQDGALKITQQKKGFFTELERKVLLSYTDRFKGMKLTLENCQTDMILSPRKIESDTLKESPILNSDGIRIDQSDADVRVVRGLKLTNGASRLHIIVKGGTLNIK